ncbi:DUF4214 domain-containing protein [Pseudoroseomonas globiformis]|uniref:DUF4214 domain-containing protein n=1 Tax=Teichococcus globiformis TaxID=2307229 RepID=A0ABV7G1F0_9PROT
MALLVSGDVPNSILENNRPGDWVATLALIGPMVAQEARVTGAATKLFEASVDHFSGKITILPLLSFDREAYPSGADPVFVLGLEVMVEGIWQKVSQTWSVTLQGVDDSPPRDVFFATGGYVLENDVGGIIGRIQGRDADTPTSKLTYAMAGQSDWFFEIVDGNILKLRDGVDLLGKGGQVIEVQVEVSDGYREASFMLAIQVFNVEDADDLPAPPPVEVPVEPPGGQDPDPTDPGPGDPGTSNPGTSDPGTSDPGTSNPGTSGPGTSGPGTPNPGSGDPEPSDPGPVAPGPGLPGDGGPVPPAPEAASAVSLRVEARASLDTASGLTIRWQAEQKTLWSDGHSEIRVLAGEALWRPPDMVLRDLAAGWSGAESQPVRTEWTELLPLASVLGASGIWTAQDSGVIPLTTVLRDALAHDDPSVLALTDGQLMAMLTSPAQDRSIVADNLLFHMTLGSAVPPSSPATARSDLPLSADALVSTMYQALLGRAPDGGELAFGRMLLGQDSDGSSLVQRLSQSGEAFALQQAQDDSSFAASLHALFSDAPPDAGGLAHWTGLLGSGALSRGELALSVLGHYDVFGF